MIHLLQAILCAIEKLAYSILAVIIMAFNAVIVALAALVTALLAVMPPMPTDLPTMPSEVTTVLSWIAWVIPVNTIVDILGFMVTMWLLWYVVMIGLRWAKASGD